MKVIQIRDGKILFLHNFVCIYDRYAGFEKEDGKKIFDIVADDINQQTHLLTENIYEEDISTALKAIFNTISDL